MADKLNYKVGMIGALDMLRFKNMPKVREKAIQARYVRTVPTQRRSSSRPRTAPPSRRSEPGNTSACASPSAGP